MRNWMLGAGALLLGTVALAQTETDSAGIDFRKTVNLTAQETVGQSKKYQQRMREIQTHIETLQEQAKKRKDIVKLNCVNDKLLRVKGHLMVINQSMQDLNASISRGDDAGRQHEFTRATILYQKVLVLATESENCIGEDVSYIGATRVDVEIDPSIPTVDPTAHDIPMPDVTRPQEASPFI